MLKAGDTLGAIQLTTDFSGRGGGRSESAFGLGSQGEVFVKRFLNPRYPVAQAPGSTATKQRLREECGRFEARHRRLIRTLAPMTGPGGHVVETLSFFRAGASYYKVHERLHPAMGAHEVHTLKRRARLGLMLGAASGLALLDRAGVINPDVKSDNLMVVEPRSGVHGAKLIDCDEAFFTDEPLPPPEVLVGDPAFQSPELDAYIRGESDGSDIAAPASVFSLGMVFAIWQTGAPPPLPSDASTPAMAVTAGTALHVASDDADVDRMIEAMLHPTASARPSAGAVGDRLRQLILATPRRAADDRRRAAEPLTGPALKGSLLRRGTAPAPPGEAGREAITAGTVLRGSLLKPRP